MAEDATTNGGAAETPPGGDLDAEIQRELQEALGEESLESLMDADAAGEGAALAGDEQVRTGKVVSIQGDDIFVEVGGRSEGVLPAAQFADEDMPSVGDSVEFAIQSYDDDTGMLVLRRKGAAQAADWETLEEGQIIEGRVTGQNKGGLELLINGIRAFMPVSQIEMFRVEDLSDYVNQRMTCQVTEVDRSSRNLIVSRRALLELEAEQAREKLWESLQEDQVLDGTVTTIMPYGAFVDIGGAEGLLHVRDISYGRVENVKDVLKEGQKVTVKVLALDREARKISLGLKQTLPDPWDTVEQRWAAGAVVTGRVTRLADFGAFVELEAGVEGLVPIGEMSFERRLRHPSEAAKEGDMIRVRIMTVDTERRRISLSMKRAGEDPLVRVFWTRED